jgi:tetratricopeptide (TPR) repeat protein
VRTSSKSCCRRSVWISGAGLRLALVLGCLSIPTLGRAQWDVDPAVESDIQAAIGQIYNLQFYDANNTVERIIRAAPDHPAGHFFKAMVLWWRILANFDNESYDGLFEEELEKVIDVCDERLERNADDVTALFFKGGSLGFRGRLRANRGNWVGAAKDGVAALPIVRKAYALAPDNTDVLLGIGIYNYYAAVIPERYPLVKPLMIFFPSGDRALGLEQLEKAARTSRYASTEATYFLAQSYYQFEKNYPRALQFSELLHQRYPRNPLFHRYVGRCLVSLGRSDEAFSLFFDIQRRCQERWTGYDDQAVREAYYYIGSGYLQKKQLDEARGAFELCVQYSEKLDKDDPSGFQVMALLSLGKIEDLQGHRQQALDLYEKVLDMPDYQSAHRQAEVLREYPYRGN